MLQYPTKRDSLVEAKGWQTHPILTIPDKPPTPKHPLAPLGPSSPESSASSTSWDNPQSDCSSPDESEAPLPGDSADYAFAFDIDGVLLKGRRVIPEARQALKVLSDSNIPYIFVTNGGGKTEAERCTDLTKQLGVGVSPDQFICGHTPMRELSHTFHTVLVVGGEGEKCRDVARTYGFTDIVTPGDMIKSDPAVTPFRKLTPLEQRSSRARDLRTLRVDAIFVFADSRHWGDDAQIILELLMSVGGRMGTRSDTLDDGPPIYWSHNDVLWSTDYRLSRYGMGAFRVFVEGMYFHQTGKVLSRSVAFGKPQVGTYRFATRVLGQWCRTRFRKGPPKTVYFVGDTCESDIKGTSDYHQLVEEEWYSILVETGVYQTGTVPAHTPRAIVKNVLEAVRHGIARSEKNVAM